MIMMMIGIETEFSRSKENARHAILLMVFTPNDSCTSSEEGELQKKIHILCK